MIDPKKLMCGALLAPALMIGATLTGVGGPLIGVEAAQAQTVSRISVSGNSRVDSATVISYLSIRQGDQASRAAIDASIASLYATGLFSSVTVGVSGSTLNVRVVENPIVASVLFEGNRRFPDAELLSMVDVATRGSVSPERLNADTESIRLAYQRAGFSNVSVTTRQEVTDTGRQRIVFVINEGDRTGISAINFTGNNSIDAGTLKGIIRTKESHLLSWLFKDDEYSADKLMLDRELIRQYYANRGFPDAQVTSAVAEYDASRNGYFINFTVVEGDRYRFGNIGVETSIPGLDANRLTGAIRTREGGRYSLAELQRSAEDLAFEATGQGYAFADVRPRLDRDIATGTFNVTYLVDEGARIYVERINITGNLKTRDYVIRRELEFGEGDPFNRSIVQRGRTAIERLGFFSKVAVSTAPGSSPDRVVINVDVEEQSTGDYGISAGYSTDDGILGEVSVTERNFLGRGQYLRASVGATGSGQTYEFSFTEPRFMGLKVSSGIDVYHRNSDESDSNRYGSTSTGGQLRLGLPVTRDLSLTGLVGVETRKITDLEAPFTYLLGGDGSTGIEADFNKAWVGYSLVYNGLDDPKKPREGLYATFSQQYVGWDHNYLKTEARARYFMPVLDDSGIVASVRGQAGIINALGDEAVSPFETFRPGATLVRGFEGRGLGPRHAVSEEILGVTSYAGISAEVEFPIPMLPDNFGVSGAVWADAAWIDGAGGDFPVLAGSIDDPLKASVGASIIWDSPFGPLRGDFAYVLNKATLDKSQVFQLTMQSLL
ncbi:Beta-barrel assembly machine subunit BamA [Devosia enhydra]|uniref:Outer membrane protein assembly factor BamA n=1 Tax=Devosia enhydra TaxID=665118 RepID=A0A1K2HUQ0_9HYPH|nr:outer membrane protein assembly factor BamA [Devosia enhydra]SFZ82049.1 Beta-barrel assembly machine subunit BamA [Devosia enhydra]